jgi:hypothetical protein
MRRRRTLPLIISFLILAVVFGLIGFTTAYYKYSGQIAREKSERQKEQELLQALIRAQEDSLYNSNKNSETTVTNYNDTISCETQLVYRTLYAQCEDIDEEVQGPTLELIGLNRDGLEEYLIRNQLDWEIEGFLLLFAFVYQKIRRINSLLLVPHNLCHKIYHCHSGKPGCYARRIILRCHLDQIKSHNFTHFTNSAQYVHNFVVI